MTFQKVVIPSQAGIQIVQIHLKAWIPLFTEMTEKRI